MDAYASLIFLSALVIFSYLFDLLAKRTRVPSVLLLLGVGILLRLLADVWGIHPVNVQLILPALGNIGLILIVFEGALDLTYAREKRRVIRKALLSSLFLLLLSVAIIAAILHWTTDAAILPCVANAVPLSVISSAVAIPSARGLPAQEREFIVYESSFSDILGVILFNFLVTNETFGAGALGGLGLEVISVLALGAIFSMALLWLLGRITHHVKFFLILSILVLVYAIGKSFHLSTLVVVLAFGMILANADRLPFPWFKERFLYPDFHRDLDQFHSLSNESAFLIRTFFFVLFGFSVLPAELADANAAVLCGALLAATYAGRALFLKLALHLPLVPLLYLAPRGLISILLFFSLPERLLIPGLGAGLFFLLVLTSCVVMALGLIAAGRNLPLDERSRPIQ